MENVMNTPDSKQETLEMPPRIYIPYGPACLMAVSPELQNNEGGWYNLEDPQSRDLRERILALQTNCQGELPSMYNQALRDAAEIVSRASVAAVEGDAADLPSMPLEIDLAVQRGRNAAYYIFDATGNKVGEVYERAFGRWLAKLIASAAASSPAPAEPLQPTGEQEKETFSAKHFTFGPCYHSMVKPDCPRCCQSHAIRMEMQLGKLEASTALPIRERVEKALREHMAHCYQVYKGVPPTVDDWIGGALHYAMWGLENDLPLPAATTSPETPEKCVKCGHRATIDGVCQVGTGAPHPVTGYKAICGCKCKFSAAALRTQEGEG